jgi:hypothetical protein
VDRAALLREMIAVPADPEKPEINSAIEDFVSRAEKRIGREGVANLGGRRRAQCIRTDGYLLMVQLWILSAINRTPIESEAS